MSDSFSPIEREAAEFRQEALDHYLQYENSATILRISPPSVWILFWTVTVAVVVAVTVAYFAHVEETAAGTGVLRPQLTAVAFLPERDRSFVTPGDSVRIDVNQLPSAEFGAVTARITRIASDPASREELKSVFAEQVPAYRVDLALDRTAARLPLRPGMLFNVHYTIRRRRVITLLFPPLGKWIS